MKFWPFGALPLGPHWGPHILFEQFWIPYPCQEIQVYATLWYKCGAPCDFGMLRVKDEKCKKFFLHLYIGGVFYSSQWDLFYKKNMPDYWIKVNRKPTSFGDRLTVLGNYRNNTALVASQFNQSNLSFWFFFFFFFFFFGGGGGG